MPEQSGREQGAVAVEIYIAAANQDTDTLALQIYFRFPGGREAQTAGGFNHQFHARREETHAFNQLLVCDSEDVIDIALNNRERVMAQVLSLGAVGDRLGRLDMNDGAAAQ